MPRHPAGFYYLTRVFLPSLLFLGLLLGCGGLPFGSGGINGPGTPTARQVSFDGPVTFRLGIGETLPGTNIGYNGKLPDGRANVSIAGQLAPKKAGDSLNWSGAPVPFSLVNLDSRILTFDDSSINFVGTVKIIIQNAVPQPGPPAQNYVAEFTIPVTYTLNRNQTLAGMTLKYIGKASQGAQFGGVEGYPYRQQFDSVVWEGHLRDRVYLHLDARVLNFSDTSASLGGTLSVRFE